MSARTSDVRSQTLVPTMRLRWREVFRVDDGQVAVSVPSWPECGPNRYVLEQAFHRPDSSEHIWIEIEVAHD